MGSGKKKAVLAAAVTANIGILCVFKYAGFFVATVDSMLHLGLKAPQVTLPIGISFFTFQALSYVIDVYRGQVEVQRNFGKVLLYISFFPQLIAGPIVKYRDIALEIGSRSVNLKETALGLRRFICGLAKKILIANTMAVAADHVFQQGMESLDILGAWVGAVAYTMQIYYDFSGYSDMAIGMGRMFGFHFRENFEHPYGSLTIKEFWRRWHISLSSWFKEYVYIPLGGNRKGRLRTGFNKVIVFFLTGLWHGANWTFVAWGLFHGAFSFLEEAVPAMKKLPRAILHVYTMLVVTVGFVMFRADTLGQAFSFIGKMFAGFHFTAASLSFACQQLTPFFLAMLAAAVAGCAPLRRLTLGLRAASEQGNDLNRMLYTFYGEKELDYRYAIQQNYAYTDGGESVEDVWIGTEGGSGNGTLLMFRDSFGNTLIPLIAGQFQEAWFTKESPYGLAALMGQCRPDTVVFEKVGRNLAEFLNMPPIIPAPGTDAPQAAEPVESNTTISIGPLEFDFNYYKISGEVDSAFLGEETNIVIQVGGSYYKAYHTGSNGYVAYMEKENMPAAPVELGVLTEDQGAYRTVQTKQAEKRELLP